MKAAFIVIARLISSIILTLFLLAAATMLFLAVTGKMPTVIETDSMSPEFHAGDVAILSPADLDNTESINVGDIIAYPADVTDSTVLTVHRVIDINDETTLTTRGDYNNFADDPIDISHVEGTLDTIIPGAGDLMKYIKENYAMLNLVAILLAVAAVSSFKNLKLKESVFYDEDGIVIGKRVH